MEPNVTDRKGIILGFQRVSNKWLYQTHTSRDERIAKVKGKTKIKDLFNTDEKDLPHNIPDPVLMHTITCKKCGKSDLRSVKYTQNCSKCDNYLLSGNGKKFSFAGNQSWEQFTNF